MGGGGGRPKGGENIEVNHVTCVWRLAVGSKPHSDPCGGGRGYGTFYPQNSSNFSPMHQLTLVRRELGGLSCFSWCQRGATLSELGHLALASLSRTHLRHKYQCWGWASVQVIPRFYSSSKRKVYRPKRPLSLMLHLEMLLIAVKIY